MEIARILYYSVVNIVQIICIYHTKQRERFNHKGSPPVTDNNRCWWYAAAKCPSSHLVASKLAICNRLMGWQLWPTIVANKQLALAGAMSNVVLTLRYVLTHKRTKHTLSAAASTKQRKLQHMQKCEQIVARASVFICGAPAQCDQTTLYSDWIHAGFQPKQQIKVLQFQYYILDQRVSCGLITKVANRLRD